MTRDDAKLWKKVADTCRPLGETHAGPYGGAMHVLISLRSPSEALDLHGMTVNQAFNETLQFLHRARESGKKEVTVITGKSGQICEEFPKWLDHNALVRSVKKLPNGGSFVVRLTK